MLYMEVRDPRVPSSYDKAILNPMWKTAICVELEKFKKHNCLLLMHFDGHVNQGVLCTVCAIWPDTAGR